MNFSNPGMQVVEWGWESAPNQSNFNDDYLRGMKGTHISHFFIGLANGTRFDIKGHMVLQPNGIRKINPLENHSIGTNFVTGGIE